MRSMTDEGLPSLSNCTVVTPHPVGSANHPLPYKSGLPDLCLFSNTQLGQARVGGRGFAHYVETLYLRPL